MDPIPAPALVDDGQGTERGLRDGQSVVACYGSVEGEYRCVRERVGLQDLNHFGRITVSGDQAMDLVNHVILTDLAALAINRAQPSFLLDDSGRPVCELFILHLGSHYLLLSEGAPPATVLSHITAAASLFPAATVNDASEQLGLLSIDGPYAWELLKRLIGLGIIGTRYLDVVPDQSIAGIPLTLCRAGRTGEYGYLMLAAAAHLPALWGAVRDAGEPFSLLPVGYRAIDLCRLENCNVSTRNEGGMVDNVLELNTRTMLGRDKQAYVGRAALQAVIAQGVARRLIGITFDAAVPQEQDDIAAGASISFEQQPIGRLANAGYSFGLRRWIGLALVDAGDASVGVNYTVQTERDAYQVRTVSVPFLANRSLSVRPQEDSYFA